MERISEKEKEQLRQLQAKYKRAQRDLEEFYKEADSRKEELLKRWNYEDRLELAAKEIGTDVNTLYAYITREDQKNYFWKQHQSQQSSD